MGVTRGTPYSADATFTPTNEGDSHYMQDPAGSTGV